MYSIQLVIFPKLQNAICLSGIISRFEIIYKIISNFDNAGKLLKFFIALFVLRFCEIID